MSSKRYKSDAFESVHETAQALDRTGVIDKATMRNFDVSCLSIPATYAPADCAKPKR
jgi:putative transcriptional regulator